MPHQDDVRGGLGRDDAIVELGDRPAGSRRPEESTVHHHRIQTLGVVGEPWLIRKQAEVGHDVARGRGAQGPARGSGRSRGTAAAIPSPAGVDGSGGDQLDNGLLVGGDDEGHLGHGEEQLDRLEDADGDLGQAPVDIVDEHDRRER